MVRVSRNPILRAGAGLLLTLAQAAAAADDAPAAPAAGHRATGLETVHKLFAAFNRQDAQAVGQLLAPEAQWLSVSAKGIDVAADGRAAVIASLRDYFASGINPVSTIETAFVNGPYVVLRERAAYDGKQGRLAQTAVAVYEVRDGRVLRVWYYPAIDES